MQVKDTTADAWPELDEAQNPLLSTTHQSENASIVIDMDNSNKMSGATKEDLNQPHPSS